MILVSKASNNKSYTLLTAPFNRNERTRLLYFEDIDTFAYNDGFHWRSTADNSILNTAENAFLINENYI